MDPDLPICRNASNQRSVVRKSSVLYQRKINQTFGVPGTFVTLRLSHEQVVDGRGSSGSHIRGSVVVGPEIRETIVLDEASEHVGI